MANEFPQIGYTPFPSDWIDPKLKHEKKYNIEYAKAAYYLWQSDACLIPSTRRTDYITNRKYAEGNQDNTKYKRSWTHTEIDGNTKKQYSYADLNYSVVSVIPKYRDIVLGYLEKLDYEPVLSAIDPLSDSQRRGKRYELWAKKKLNDMMMEAQIMAQMGEEDQQLPQTQEELDMYMNNFKLATEIAMAGILNLDFDVNKWPEVAKKVREDLFDNAIAGTREYTTKGGRHVIRYVDPVNLFVRKTRSNECFGSNAIGEVIEMTISALYADAGDAFSLEEYKKIASQYGFSTNRANDIYDGYIDTDSDQYQANIFLQQWGDTKIRVFDLTWFTIDDEYYEERTNAQGEKRTVPADYGYSPPIYSYAQDGDRFYKTNNKTKKQEDITKDAFYKGRNKPQKKAGKSSAKMVYGCKWIVGSANEGHEGFVYDYGKMTDIPREPQNIKETNLPYHIYRYSNKSIVERMMPLADSYMLAWLKIQNAMSRARPKGVIVEITALENMSIGGKPFSPLQSLAVFDATGNLIYKGTGAQGDPTRHRPVEETNGGMGSEWQELIGYLNTVEEMIQRVSGFNDVFAAISPDPKQSVAGSKMAINQSYNAIQSMLSGFNNIYLRTAKSSSLRFQIMSHYGQLKGYEGAIGEAAKKIIEYGEDMSLIEFGIKMDIRPTSEQKAKIEAAALQAMNTRDAQGIPQITYSDYLFVIRCLDGGNLKYAESVLAYRINKRVIQQQQINQQNSEMNAKIQTESTKVAEAEARKTLEFETRQKLILINAEADAEIRVNDHKLSKVKETEVVKADSKVQQTDSTNATKKELKALEIATQPEENVGDKK